MALRPLSEEEKLDIEMGRMIRRVAADPKTRRDLYQTLKKSDPKIRWPDQDIEELRRELEEKAEREKIERDAARHKANVEEQRESAVKRYGEEHVKKVEKLMEKHGIFDYSVGAKLYAAEHPPADKGQSYPDSNRWSMPSDKELISDPAKWANEMAHKTIAEFRRARGLPSPR